MTNSCRRRNRDVQKSIVGVPPSPKYCVRIRYYRASAPRFRNKGAHIHKGVEQKRSFTRSGIHPDGRFLYIFPTHDILLARQRAQRRIRAGVNSMVKKSRCAERGNQSLVCDKPVRRSRVALPSNLATFCISCDTLTRALQPRYLRSLFTCWLALPVRRYRILIPLSFFTVILSFERAHNHLLLETLLTESLSRYALVYSSDGNSEALKRLSVGPSLTIYSSTIETYFPVSESSQTTSLGNTSRALAVKPSLPPPTQTRPVSDPLPSTSSNEYRYLSGLSHPHPISCSLPLKPAQLGVFSWLYLPLGFCGGYLRYLSKKAGRNSGTGLCT
jgi:hypothetical protein